MTTMTEATMNTKTMIATNSAETITDAMAHIRKNLCVTFDYDTFIAGRFITVQVNGQTAHVQQLARDTAADAVKAAGELARHWCAKGWTTRANGALFHPLPGGGVREV